jgi:adenosine deaminase
VCPLSNIKLCVFPNLQAHTLKRLLDAGIVATVNSDDPAYFGGYMNANFVAVAESLQLDAAQLRQLAENSLVASFASAADKRADLDRLAAYCAQSGQF